MYVEKEKLLLVRSHGLPDSKTYLPKGSEVEFVKVIHNPNDLAQSMVIVKYNDRIIPMMEVNVKPKDTKKLESEFKKFNNAMMERNPELKKYHPNYILRYYYRLKSFIKRIFT